MSSESICIIFLCILYVYQSYRHWKLEKLVFKQLSDVWNFQHMEVERFARLSNEQERNISKNGLS